MILKKEFQKIHYGQCLEVDGSAFSIKRYVFSVIQNFIAHCDAYTV